MSDISLAASGFDSNKRPAGPGYQHSPAKNNAVAGQTVVAPSPKAATPSELPPDTAAPSPAPNTAVTLARDDTNSTEDSNTEVNNNTTGPAEAALAQAGTTLGTAATPSAQSNQSLEETVTQINDYVQSIQRELQFSIDDESGETVVKVIEKATNEVVRQIPAEDLMETLKNLNQNATAGIMFNNQA